MFFFKVGFFFQFKKLRLVETGTIKSCIMNVDVDLPAVETEMDVLRAKLEPFETEFIINMDESALLCRCLPNRISYVSE